MVFGAMALGCDDRASWRLSRAECVQWFDQFFTSPGAEGSLMDELGASGDESDAVFIAEVRAKFIGGCVDGDVDRQELECLRRAKNDTEHIRCVYEGEQRRERRERGRL